eukprot:scaffold34618_cov159-Amphora_coffeaeformis.AAC.12
MTAIENEKSMTSTGGQCRECNLIYSCGKDQHALTTLPKVPLPRKIASEEAKEFYNGKRNSEEYRYSVVARGIVGSRGRVMPPSSAKKRPASSQQPNGKAAKRARKTVDVPTALDIGGVLPRAHPKAPPAETIKTKKTKKKDSPPVPTPEIASKLSDTDAYLWHQGYAAKAACHWHSQLGRKVRLVGTITRKVYADTSVDPFPTLLWNSGKHPVPFVSKNHHPRSFKAPTPSQARQEILRELPDDHDLTDGQLVLRANQLMQQWKTVLGDPYGSGWDARGELLNAPTENSVRVSQILRLLEDGTLTDADPEMSRGEIAVDTKTVLTSLGRFCVPEDSLYGQPMVVSFVLPSLLKRTPKQSTYELKICVFVHRLAFEILSLYDTHIIWSALDEDSYKVVRPLFVPPKVDPPFFQSAPTPRVVVDDEEEEEDLLTEDNEGDVFLETSTRRSDVVSAYTFEGLLKLLESPGNDTTNWPSIETRLKHKLQIDLLPHQKHGVCWMMQQEQIEGGLNVLMWEERQFSDGQGSYFFSPAVGQIRLHLGGNGRNRMKENLPVGGILADMMGLGKTVQMLALILATKNDENDHDDPTTLVVVPPALLSQWKSETAKITGIHLNTQVFDADTRTFQPAFEGQQTEGNVDLVLTTYPALAHQAAARVLRSHSWKRIVLDEMQEIRSSTTKLAHNCQDLTGHRRWMLSGTPLFDEIQDLRGELCFLGLEPFAANSDDGFFDFCITQHWDSKSHYGLDALKALTLVMMRRSKTQTYLDPVRNVPVPLLGLPPLELTMEPVPQDPSERAIYCFLEYLVHSNLGDEYKDKEEADTRRRFKGKHDEGKRKLFLKFLRDACASAHLLTGGLGCTTRLDTLDRVMIEHNRRNGPSGGESAIQHTGRALSVEQAVEFLSRVVDTARVEEGFVTTQTVGGGMGRSRRERAFESADVKLGEAKERLKNAEKEMRAVKSRRAKARWHKALEMITTGSLSNVFSDVRQKGSAEVHTSIHNLWRWRRLVIRTVEDKGMPLADLPEFLVRGWRPTTSFFRSESFYRARDNWRKLLHLVVQGEAFQTKSEFLPKENLQNSCKFNRSDSSSDGDSTTKHPVNVSSSLATKTRKYHALWRWRFFFKHNPKRRGETTFPGLSLRHSDDRCLALMRISKRFRWAHPLTLLLEDIPLTASIDDVRHSITAALEKNDASDALLISPVTKLHTTWKAYVTFSKAADFGVFFSRAKRRDGVGLETRDPPHWIVDEYKKASDILRDATAAVSVYPCDTNIRNLSEAKKAHKLAGLGLRMHASNTRAGHVSVHRAFQFVRSDLNDASWKLLERCLTSIECKEDLVRQTSVISAEHRTLERLKKVADRQISTEVQNLSTFEVLEALKSGKNEQTGCPVCLCPLGDDETSGGKVALTRCGHLFCTGCLHSYFQTKRVEGNHTPSCIACRKQIHESESVIVDPSINDDSDVDQKRDAARSLLREASEQLEQSNGHLEPSLWNALYLSFDLPTGTSKARNSTYTAIPGHLLAHLRHTSGLLLSGRMNTKSDADSSRTSSKIRKLMNDLPKGERSVVFATSSMLVKHLMRVLAESEFAVRGLFTGQAEADSRKALDEWREEQGGVLVVQSGAAACGLTLTDASKMFLMEPFLRYEEEQQAYSRLHRYGQTKKVECKVYFAPVTVESRLLEWRKKEKRTNIPDEKLVFAQLKSDEESIAAEEEDVTQSRFLLGLDKWQDDDRAED